MTDSSAALRKACASILAAALALTAPAVSAAPARVAYLSSSDAGDQKNLDAFVAGMRGLGWSVDRLQLDARFSGGAGNRLVALAEDLVAARPEVIVCTGPAPAVALKNAALKNAGIETPVVFVAIADPIALGLAESLARPGRNFTGLSTIVPENFLEKQMQLLHAAVPGARRIALLTNPANPIHQIGRELRLASARKNGLAVVEIQAANAGEIAAAMREAAKQGAELLYVSGDPLAVSQRKLIADEAVKLRMATMFLFATHVEAGGLMSYGPDGNELHRRAALYVDKILKGAHPADLAIEQPTTFQFTINATTAAALGVALTPQLRLMADRIIETAR